MTTNKTAPHNRLHLEGSVQKTANRVRITVQLIDATTGGQVWADRYDRELQDIFALQDAITQQIVTTLKLQLTVRERGLLVGRSPGNVAAYDTLLRGLVSLGQTTKEANTRARDLFEKALEIDPQYAEAYAFLGRTHWMDWVFAWSADRPQSLERAFAAAQKAVRLNDALPLAHSTLGQVYM